MKIKNLLLIPILAISVLLSASFVIAQESSVATNNRVGCFKFVSPLGFGSGVQNVNLSLVKFGSDSEIYKVLELQNTLIDAGYMSGKATGYFGGKTFKAVKKYQKENNIRQTGYVGEKTLGILRSQFCNISILPITCDYAAPPIGCNYVQGPDYNSVTGCGMKLECKDNKIKDCPSEKIINMMPVMCIRAPCPAIDNSYYIYNGNRKDISDFDTNYVKNNCSVKKSVVY